MHQGNLSRRITITAALLMLFALAVPALSYSAPNGQGGDRGRSPATLTRLGTIKATGAEIVAYDPRTEHLFTTAATDQVVDVIDASNPSRLSVIDSVDLSAYGSSVTSVDVSRGLVAAAVIGDPPQSDGTVVFFSPDGQVISDVTVGAGPDMVTFTPNGRQLLVANEGEPEGYCAGQVDPEGSVSVIDTTGSLGQSAVRSADFTGIDQADLDPTVRISGPNATIAQDIEPEYIAVAPNGRNAFVTLQENNAVATVDLRTATVTSVDGLGYKNHNAPGNGLDPSDRDGGIHIARWPVQGLYMPDAIAAFESKRETYLVYANEGDAREWDCFEDTTRIGDIDPADLPPGIDPSLQADDQLGRLDVVTTAPARAGDGSQGGQMSGLFSLGARSFSVRDSSGRLVFDSGDAFEQITAREVPALYNSEEGDISTFDTRSDAKGPEPEGITTGKVDGRQLAFISLERTGGIMVYDVTDPGDAEFQSYLNSAGDVAPEGLRFIPAAQSPNGRPILATANEVSGTATLYQIG